MEENVAVDLEAMRQNICENFSEEREVEASVQDDEFDPILKENQSSYGSFRAVKLIFNRNADSEFTLREFSPD